MYVYYDKEGVLKTQINHGEVLRQGSDLHLTVCFDPDFVDNWDEYEIYARTKVDGGQPNYYQTALIPTDFDPFELANDGEITYALVPNKVYKMINFEWLHSQYKYITNQAGSLKIEVVMTKLTNFTQCDAQSTYSAQTVYYVLDNGQYVIPATQPTQSEFNENPTNYYTLAIGSNLINGVINAYVEAVFGYVGEPTLDGSTEQFDTLLNNDLNLQRQINDNKGEISTLKRDVNTNSEDIADLQTNKQNVLAEDTTYEKIQAAIQFMNAVNPDPIPSDKQISYNSSPTNVEPILLMAYYNILKNWNLNLAQNDRLDSAESRLSGLDNDIIRIDGVDAAQNGRLTAIERQMVTGLRVMGTKTYTYNESTGSTPSNPVPQSVLNAWREEYYETIPEEQRHATNGDLFYVNLIKFGTDTFYICVYNVGAQEWSENEAQFLEAASNTTKGIIQGTNNEEDKALNPNVIFSISDGKIVDALVKYGVRYQVAIGYEDGVTYYVNNGGTMALANPQPTVDNFTQGTYYIKTTEPQWTSIKTVVEDLEKYVTGVKAVPKAIGDKQGRDIVDTYVTRGSNLDDGATKGDLYDYAAPRILQDVYYPSYDPADAEISEEEALEEETPNFIQGTLVTDKVNNINKVFELTADTATTLAEFTLELPQEVLLTKKNGITTYINLEPSANVGGSVVVRAYYQRKNSDVRVLLGASSPLHLDMVEGHIVNPKVELYFGELSDELLLNVEDNLIMSVSLTTDDDATITFIANDSNEMVAFLDKLVYKEFIINTNDYDQLTNKPILQVNLDDLPVADATTEAIYRQIASSTNYNKGHLYIKEDGVYRDVFTVYVKGAKLGNTQCVIDSDLNIVIPAITPQTMPFVDLDESGLVDDNPTQNSDNLVKSGGVYDALQGKIDKPAVEGTEGQILTKNSQGGESWEDPVEAPVQSVALGSTDLTPDANGKVVIPEVEAEVMDIETADEVEVVTSIGATPSNDKIPTEKAVADAIDDAASTKTDLSDIAPNYDNTSTYAVGDCVNYDGDIYKCNTAISVAEAWDSTHWTRKTVQELIDENQPDLSNYVNLNGAQVITGQKTFSSNILVSNIIIGKAPNDFTKPNIQFTNSMLALYGHTYIKDLLAPLERNGVYASLGSSSNKWKDLYLSGNLTDGTNSISIANIANKNDIPSLAGYATETYVNNAIDALPEPMVFKGTLGTGGTITDLPAASSSNEGFTYKVITAGTYQSVVCKVGDVVVSNGSAWVLIPAGDTDSDTWRDIDVNGTSFKGSGISSGKINFKNGSHITFTTNGNDLQMGVENGYSIPSDTKQNGWDAKYDKPSGGIPATDLASAVQTSLGKADTAVQNPMTSAGDLIVGGASGTPTRLAKGNAGQVLQVNSAGTGLEYADAKGVTDLTNVSLSGAASLSASPNVYYNVNGTLTSLTINMVAPASANIENKYHIRFSTTASFDRLIVNAPSNTILYWGDLNPDCVGGENIYDLIIYNNLATLTEYPLQAGVLSSAVIMNPSVDTATSTQGTLVLTNTSSNETITSGTKVPVNTNCQVVATPGGGYELYSLTINGKSIANNSVQVIGYPSYIEARFQGANTTLTYNIPSGVTVTVKQGSTSAGQDLPSGSTVRVNDKIYVAVSGGTISSTSGLTSTTTNNYTITGLNPSITIAASQS